MKKIIIGTIIGIVIVFLLQYFFQKKEENTQITENSTLIYQDAKKYLNNWISFDKKALIVVNAEATISYDLHQLRYEIDPALKVVRLLHIPQEELKIYPNIQYYNLEESSFNPFTAEDHNKIQQKVTQLINKKIEQSSFRSNAQNQLLSELSRILILTHSMGWRLEYTNTPIERESDLLLQLKK